MKIISVNKPLQDRYTTETTNNVHIWLKEKEEFFRN